MQTRHFNIKTPNFDLFPILCFYYYLNLPTQTNNNQPITKSNKVSLFSTNPIGYLFYFIPYPIYFIVIYITFIIILYILHYVRELQGNK